ncbi:MAG: esterase family protein, partial [Acidobacteriota bacterium]|nr:esterase family protein [Acidobacteriota bacterium]
MGLLLLGVSISGSTVRRLMRLPILLAAAAVLSGSDALILDRAHYSRVLNETRNYRIFLPRDYQASGKRYPVIYWFHGFSERYNKPVTGTPNRNYDQGSDYGGDTIASFVGAHDVIAVKWDGYN